VSSQRPIHDAAVSAFDAPKHFATSASLLKLTILQLRRSAIRFDQPPIAPKQIDSVSQCLKGLYKHSLSEWLTHLRRVFRHIWNQATGMLQLHELFGRKFERLQDKTERNRSEPADSSKFTVCRARENCG